MNSNQEGELQNRCAPVSEPEPGMDGFHGPDLGHNKDDVVRINPANMQQEPTWTLANATEFVRAIEPDLLRLGFQKPEIVGSVAKNGHSSNDLDLLLRPCALMHLDEAIGRIEKFLPNISDDLTLNPLESKYNDEDEWFFNIGLRDGRVIEFYMTAGDFPFSPEALEFINAPVTNSASSIVPPNHGRKLTSVRPNVVEVRFERDAHAIYKAKLDLTTGNVFDIQPMHRWDDECNTSIVVCQKTIPVTHQGNGIYAVRQEQLVALNDAVFEDLSVGLKVQSADGTIQDGFTVWEGGTDVAHCYDIVCATRVAKALRLSGSVEHIWVTKGDEYENVYDDQPESPTEANS